MSVDGVGPAIVQRQMGHGARGVEKVSPDGVDPENYRLQFQKDSHDPHVKYGSKCEKMDRMNGADFGASMYFNGDDIGKFFNITSIRFCKIGTGCYSKFVTIKNGLPSFESS